MVFPGYQLYWKDALLSLLCSDQLVSKLHSRYSTSTLPAHGTKKEFERGLKMSQTSLDLPKDVDRIRNQLTLNPKLKACQTQRFLRKMRILMKDRFGVFSVTMDTFILLNNIFLSVYHVP